MKKQAEQRVLLGFEIGTGERIEIPIAHTVVTGLTQQSGKTTTLEALVARSPERRAVAFITKRSEGAFHNARMIKPFFREQADWQFVESLLEATMRQRMKFERAWIMRVTRGAHSLEDVHVNILTQLNGDQAYRDGHHKKSKVKPATGMSGDIYLQLSAYFDILLPQVSRLRLRMQQSSPGLQLEPGLNVMDLTEFSTEMQSLIIASTIDSCYLLSNVTAIIPEAWEFLPQGRKTPVIRAAEAFVRKGAAAMNFLWLDSQDISGVEKTILKQSSVWILGNQRETNEVEHTLKQLPLSRKARPKPEEIMHLGRGQFFCCYERETRKVYVCPQWLPEQTAKEFAVNGNDELAQAISHLSQVFESETSQKSPEIESIIAWARGHSSSDDDGLDTCESILRKKGNGMDYKQLYEQAMGRISELERKLGIHHAALNDSHVETVSCLATGEAKSESRDVAAAPFMFKSIGVADSAGTAEAIYDYVRDRLTKDKTLLRLAMEVPEIDVRKAKVIVECDYATLRGRIAALIAEGFLNEPVGGTRLWKELVRRGFTGANNCVREADRLLEMGFLTKEDGGYQAVKEMKVRITET